MTDATALAAKQGITVRAVTNVAEMGACVDLQRRVWGYSELDTVPDQIFVVADKTGGQVMVAYDGERAVGFALAFAAVRDGRAYLHSHMVAVLEDCQNRGVGRLLKLAQREDAIARGFDLIEWTFDPLQVKNAYFNIERLGAIARRYAPNLYGRTSSPLHAGLPTDRLVAEWWVRSQRVEDKLDGKLRPANSTRRISLPTNIREVCRDDPHAAEEEVQANFRQEFLSLVAGGRAAVGFELRGDESAYLLEPYED